MQTSDIDTLVWKPPLKVVNLKEVFDRDFLYDTDGYAFVNGCSGQVGVHASVRHSISCRFDFHSYPFDDQSCDLNIFAPSFTDLTRQSASGAVALTPNVRLNWASRPTILDYKFGGDIHVSGNFEQQILVMNRTDKCKNCDNFLKARRTS